MASDCEQAVKIQQSPYIRQLFGNEKEKTTGYDGNEHQKHAKIFIA